MGDLCAFVTKVPPLCVFLEFFTYLCIMSTRIAKIVAGSEVELFKSMSAAAEDLGMDRFKFARRFKKHGYVRDGEGNIYVEPKNY
jgi:hypothetical protein